MKISNAKSEKESPDAKNEVQVEKEQTFLVGDVFSYSTDSSSELGQFLGAFVEYTENSSEGKASRLAAFGKADPNGNGYCSLAELESFLMVVLKKKFDKEESNVLFRLFRPCYIRAFTEAKAIDEGNDDDDEYVQFSEFRKFLLYLCIYAIMYDAYLQINGSKDNDDDKKVDRAEFVSGYGNLTTYGFWVFNSLENDEAAANVFDEMSEGTDAVVFSEWCSYLMKKEKENNTTLGTAF